MNNFKRQIVNMMRPDGHRHFSMTDATACRKCQPKVLEAKRIYDKEVRKSPEFLRRIEPEFKPSEELKQMFDDLRERVKYDKLYREHIEKANRGTPEEKERELARINSGFYNKNSDWSKKRI